MIINRLKNMLRLKLFRSLLISHIFLSIFMIIALSSLIYLILYRSFIADVKAQSVRNLKQVSNLTEMGFDQIADMTGQLLSNHETINVLYSNQNDPLVRYRTSQLIRQIKAGRNHVYSISLFNGNTGLYFSARQDVDDDIVLRLQNGEFRHYLTVISRQISKKPDMITFIICPNYIVGNPNKSAIVINILESYLKDTINTLAEGTNGQAFIIDDKGLIVSHTQQDDLIGTILDDPPIESVLSFSDAAGSMVADIDHEKSIISYVRLDKLDWTILSIMPFSDMMHSLKLIRNATLFVALFMLILSVFISLRITRHVYSPLNHVLSRLTSSAGNMTNEVLAINSIIDKHQEQIHELNQSIKQSFPLVKIGFFHSILTCNQSVSDDDIRHFERVYGKLYGPYFNIILVSPARRLNHEPHNEMDQHATIISLLREMTEGLFRLDYIYTTGESLVFLHQGKVNVLQDSLIMSLMEFQKKCQQISENGVAISIGDPVDHINQINSSLLNAKRYEKYRYFYGEEILLRDSIVQRHLNRKIDYPESNEKSIITQTKEGSPVSIKAELEQFARTVASAEYETATDFFIRLSQSVTQQFARQLNHDLNEPSAAHEIKKHENIAETVKYLLSCFCDIHLQLVQIRTERNQCITAKVIRHIDDRYQDPDLSLSQIADALNLSASYIGKILNENGPEGGFSQYLCQIRMQAAARLLKSTDIAIDQISSRIGIRSSNYFYTLFKKVYNMTPSQYRNHISMND